MHDLSAPPPFKKRKFYRRRPGHKDEVPAETVNSELATSTPLTEPMSLDQMIQETRSSIPQSQDDIDTPLAVAELLRQRKVLQRRKGGIGFANTGDTKNTETEDPQKNSAGTDQGKVLSKLATVIDRFAPQTGQVADVDQHM